MLPQFFKRSRARDLRVTEDVVERCLGRGRDRKRGEHPKDASLCFATGEEAISGYDKRGGAVRLAEGSVLFVNWQGQQKCKTYFDRKYPNALRADGTVTWWPPKNFDEERLSEPLHLFGRCAAEQKMQTLRPYAIDATSPARHQ